MEFMIVITSDERAEAKATVEQQKEVGATYMAYTEDLKKAGVFVHGNGLLPTAKGARISHKEGRRVVIDGPFTETKEVVGGYYVINVKSREDAIEWAAKCPGARHSAVELREVMVIPG